MTAPSPIKPALLLASLASALALTACGTAVSTTNFHGAEHEVAQTVANLQADATAAEQGKICTNDLSAGVVERLGGRKACEAAIKNQVAEIDSLATTVLAVKVAPDGTTATATVQSIDAGKKTASKLALVKEGGAWKVAGL